MLLFFSSRCLAFESFVEKKYVASKKKTYRAFTDGGFPMSSIFLKYITKKKSAFFQWYLVLLLLIRFAMNAVAAKSICAQMNWRPVVRDATSLIGIYLSS